MNKTIHYVTTNSGKFNEVKRFIEAYEPSINLVQAAVDIEEIQTLDQAVIAVDKAKKAWNAVQKPLLIDDAAIYFDRFNQFPGTLTKFVSEGIGFEGLKRLIDEGDPAHFLLTIVYVEGPEVTHAFQGRCEGRLTKPDYFHGDPSLPFDVFFIPEDQQKTYLELKKDFQTFEQFNYRIRALKAFLQWYKNRPSTGSG